MEVQLPESIKGAGTVLVFLNCIIAWVFLDISAGIWAVKLDEKSGCSGEGITYLLLSDG